MDKGIWIALQPILAQGARDFLRIVGSALAAHGFIQNGAGVESFIGAGMTLAGLFWGWWTTSGYLQVGALLKKLTAQHTASDAVKAAQILPPAAAVDTKEKAISVKSVTTAVVNLLLIAFVISAFLAGSGSTAFAQARKPGPPFDLGQKLKDDFSNATGVKATGDLGFDLLKALDAKLLPDLNYALKLAQATNSNVTAPCWQAWIDMINTQQTAVKNSDGTEIDTPDPHLVTSFERMVELRNALQPDSKFMTACSPVANLVKQDVIKFMGIVITGGTGLATMIPGL